MYSHNTAEFLYIACYLQKVSFYIKREQNYISKLNSMMTHILMS